MASAEIMTAMVRRERVNCMVKGGSSMGGGGKEGEEMGIVG
jgi:hypothetical protein